MSNPGWLRRFFKGLWNGVTWLRVALSNVLFLAVLVLVFLLFKGGAPLPLPEQAALRVNLMGSVVDQKSYRDPLTTLMGKDSPAEHQVLLRDLILAIKLAKDDPAINSLVLELDQLFRMGISKTQEVAVALNDFKSSGKPVVAVGDYYTQGQYLLASHADTIILHPSGGVALEGFASYRQHFRQALDKLSVNMHVFKAGPYKSIAEPWLRDDMSDAEKAISQRWLNTLWQQYTHRVENERNLPAGTVDDLVNHYHQYLADNAGDLASTAAAMGLVDKLMTRNEASDYLVSVVGEADKDGYYQAVDFEYYVQRKRGTERNTNSSGKIAVVTAEGNILNGEQPPGTIGGDSLSRLLRRVQDAGDVDALVLRVNSGGGSTFASEVIRQALLDIKSQGIPLVVSMGSVAASGGYYIAADANEIVATPATITGSIGVFAAFPTFEKLMHKLGIHSDGVGTTALAGGARLDRPINPMVESALQQSVDRIYQDFVTLVASGRAMHVDEVEELAGGRVWSAADALDNGLIDTLGSLQDAIDIAASYASLDSWEVDYIQPQLSPAEMLLQSLSERMSGIGQRFYTGLDQPFSKQLWAPVEQAVNELSLLSDPRHLYVRCVECPGVTF